MFVNQNSVRNILQVIFRDQITAHLKSGSRAKFTFETSIPTKISLKLPRKWTKIAKISNSKSFIIENNNRPEWNLS